MIDLHAVVRPWTAREGWPIQPAADPFETRARAAGPLAPGSFRAVPSDSPDAFHDFPDLESAQKYADDVASEGDYDFIPPTAYIYDSQFRRVGEGMHYSERMKSTGSKTSPGPAGAKPSSSGLLAQLRRFFGGR